MDMDKDREKLTGRAAARRVILWITVVLLAVMTVLSIIGAFMGSKKATDFFNSPPLATFWVVLTAIFVLGFLAVKSLLKRPGLLLSHLGCLLVLIGALWGSEAAHKFRAKAFKQAKVREGYMQIHEGHSDNAIHSGDSERGVLTEMPFSIALDDFWIEYYESAGSLTASNTNGLMSTVPADEGATLSLGDGMPEVRIVRLFENFKISLDGGKSSAFDDRGRGQNPALEVEIKSPDGRTETRYVFPGRMGGHDFSYGELKLDYRYGGPAGIKDYKSSLTVLDGGEPVLRKIIEVNKPLHYGGYSFYQSSYDQERGHYTVLSVTSNSGLIFVFGGYLFLCVGVIWQCWLRHLPRRGGATL